jgi:hypothetical protein
MTTHASTESRGIRTLERARDSLGSNTQQPIAAFVVYAAIAIGYFGLHVLPHLGRVAIGEPGGTDPSILMWDLAWWPHALLHGLNPFVTNAVFAPDRVDLGGVVTIPGAALAVAPITLLFGPFVSYNLLMLASPVLAAFFAFLLCRYVTRNFAASLVGGYLFGFSTYMFGQLLGHLHVVLIFPIPAMVHLTLRLIDGRIGERRFIGLMALSLASMLLFSTEIALTSVLIGGVTLVIAFALVPAGRKRVIFAAKRIIAAGAVAAVVTSPVIYYALQGNVTAGTQGIGEGFGGDALGFLVPTILLRFGRHYFAAVSAGFTSADISEAGTYVGLPLALIVARYITTRWRLVSTRILAAMLAVVVVLLLGSHLHIAAYPTIPLPWKLIGHSLLREVIPARLALFMFLIVGTIAAMWLAQPRPGAWGYAKWAVAAVSIVFLLPNTGRDLWRYTPPNPPFFTTHEYRSVLKRGDTVLVLPYGPAGFSMLWQAETGVWFRMAGGYLNPVPPPDYANDALLPALVSGAKPNPLVLREFLFGRGVSAVIAGPGTPPEWTKALEALGLKPMSLGGVLVFPTGSISKTSASRSSSRWVLPAVSHRRTAAAALAGRSSVVGESARAGWTTN